MNRENQKTGNLKSSSVRFAFPIFNLFASLCLCGLIIFFLSACSELQKPKVEPFYAEKVEPPRVQEFRWSNGKMPKTFDPARAHAAPEADFVRALYEGLTDADSKTLQPVPAIAQKWTASDDFKIWTFNLRRDAKWSNGETVTAKDFARSWKRLVEMGESVEQRALLRNIVGMDTENVLPVFANEEIDVLSKQSTSSASLNKPKQNGAVSDENLGARNGQAPENPTPESSASRTKKPTGKTDIAAEPKSLKENARKDRFGVEAVNDYTLKITLVEPDKNFAALVAHPMFRPVYGAGREFEKGELSANIVTNGAFRVASIEPNAVVLERAEYFWNARAVNLERVRFVATDGAENALAAYRAGELDAVTNADFKPLALKLLTPYDDFRRTTHGALNFYEFNGDKPQFADARVRRALAAAIERERLTEDEMDGASRPAFKFSPFDEDEKLTQNAGEAQRLLADAGFAGGANFPAIRLLINRNDVQRRIARAVAKMWKKTLNVETQVVVGDAADYEAAYQNGDYDIIRRGVVLPTTDEAANMLALFPQKSDVKQGDAKELAKPANEENSIDNRILSDKTAESNLDLTRGENQEEKKEIPAEIEIHSPLLTEREALDRLPAIPLYFPTSYALVKPYVVGFETNALDAPSLKNVKIDNDWQPANRKLISNGEN